MPKIKARPPKGFRDFTPELMILRKELFSRLEKLFQRYGFDPIDTPSLEYWETLAGKYGEEAEGRLIWRFKDPWSKKDYALRYDLTVPLARFIANHQEILLPFKRYHIGPVWRHEEPQRGRYREFYQCDADIVGSPYPEADAEIINLTVDALKALGFERGFKVRLNDRRLLKGIFEEELSLENPINVYRTIDKLDKIGVEGVRRELLNKLKLSEITVDKITEIISVEGSPNEILSMVENKYGNNSNVSTATSHLKEILDLIKDKGSVVLDLSLVRGLDYYTGPIVEVVLDEPRIGSVAGGGRYDNLIGMFLGREIPATGVSIGIERIIDAGIELGVYKLKRKTVTQIQVIVVDRESFKYAWEVADRLRTLGFNTKIDISRAKESTQRKKARKLSIPVLVFVGEKERISETITVYFADTGERFENVKIDKIRDLVLKRLNERTFNSLAL